MLRAAELLQGSLTQAGFLARTGPPPLGGLARLVCGLLESTWGQNLLCLLQCLTVLCLAPASFFPNYLFHLKLGCLQGGSSGSVLFCQK